MYLILRKERKESGTRKTEKTERKEREGVEEAERERDYTLSDLLCSAGQNVKLVIKKEHRLPVGLKLASLLPKVFSRW